MEQTGQAKVYDMRGIRVEVAATAGFCFGVARAVAMTEELLDEGRAVATLGPLIHNPQVVGRLAARGAVAVDGPAEVPEGAVAVVRSHGVAQSVMDDLAAAGCPVCDATCPYVSKIHAIAEQCGREGGTLLVAGDAGHPEVQGIVGHTKAPVHVFATLEELEGLAQRLLPDAAVFVVAQTTYQVTNWLECVAFLKKVCTKWRVFDTICNATWARQQDAEALARRCDVVVVVGGRGSSNTKKLLSVAAAHSRAVQIETAEELGASALDGAKSIGITAGASTPSSAIEEVVTRMSDVINGMVPEDANVEQAPMEETVVQPAAQAEPATEVEVEKPVESLVEPAADASMEEAEEEEKSFEEMLDDSMKPVYAGQIVKGVVEAVSANEITVDIGTKQTGIVKLEELTDDPAVRSAEDIVKRDEEIDLVVVKVNDQDGIIYLSKRQMEARRGAEEVAKAAEEGTIMEGYVTESNKGGLVANVKGVKVFIPASQATARRGEDYTALVRSHVKLKIKEFSPRRTIGSIREVLAEEQRVLRDAFWGEVEVGKHYVGAVKSLTSYGAFVDIGGVDGLVHISELSWSRIKHPGEVVNAGDTIEVYVKDVDRENQKVSLGFKKQADNPWEKLRTEYPIGSTFTAPVVSITQFGAFVRILPGVDGLVHISEISHDRVEKVSDVLSVGQEVEVKLLDVDFDRHRISLSMKALLPVPEKEEMPLRDAMVASSSAEETTVSPEMAAEIEAEMPTEAVMPAAEEEPAALVVEEEKPVEALVEPEAEAPVEPEAPAEEPEAAESEEE